MIQSGITDEYNNKQWVRLQHSQVSPEDIYNINT